MLEQVERLGSLVEQLLDLSKLESGAVPLELTHRAGARAARAPGERLARAARSERDVLAPHLDGRARARGRRRRAADAPGALEPRRQRRPALARGRQGVASTRRARRAAAPDRGQRPGSGHRAPTRSSASSSASTAPTRRARAATAAAGLGLAIARWIVELHGGTIHAEQRSRTGCRMVVELPGSESRCAGGRARRRPRSSRASGPGRHPLVVARSWRSRRACRHRLARSTAGCSAASCARAGRAGRALDAGWVVAIDLVAAGLLGTPSPSAAPRCLAPIAPARALRRGAGDHASARRGCRVRCPRRRPRRHRHGAVRRLFLIGAMRPSRRIAGRDPVPPRRRLARARRSSFVAGRCRRARSRARRASGPATGASRRARAGSPVVEWIIPLGASSSRSSSRSSPCR